MVHKFFNENLQKIYKDQEFQSTYIWNVDEFGANASRNEVGKVLATVNSRKVYTIIPNEREWISVLICINANGGSISNYYIFKGVKAERNYLALCENGSTFGLQKRAG